MDEFARDFLRKRGIGMIVAPRFIARTAERIAEIETARPGFAAALRRAALDALASPDEDDLRHAVSALSAVGTIDDLSALEALGATGPARVAADARAAAFEIHKRARRSGHQRPPPNVRWNWQGRYGSGGCAAAFYLMPLQLNLRRSMRAIVKGGLRPD